MRLLRLDNNGDLTLTPDLINDIPPYAILSHTWGADGEEVTFHDVLQNSGESKPGYEKILFCGRQAKRDELDHFWVDTCCIDKTSSAELTKAINSMFRWYRDAAVCYVYLTDVSTGSTEQPGSWQRQFEQSRWFTRGWTLQELLAPVCVRFFSAQGVHLGDRKFLQNDIHSITKIPISALNGTALSQFPAHERLGWAHGRQTTEAEDGTYCLLGIFDVSLPLIYGEGKAKAMARLLKEVNQQTGTLSSISGLPHHPLQQVVNQKPHLILPFGQNRGFVGRDSILAKLVRNVLPSRDKNDCQRMVLEGLGGVGKTQIALEAAYRVREQDPNCSIFWVPAVTMTTFENAYRDVGQALGAPGIENDKADVKLLVKKALEKCSADWLLIIDNVDDIGLLDGEGLREYLPFSHNGSILFTTRNHEVAVELDIPPESIYAISEMDEAEALNLLKGGLQAHQLQDSQATGRLLKYLAYLPLAIKQASAYMAKRGTTTRAYLQYCHNPDEKQIQLLSAEFEDRWRYSRKTNPIATTWLISFRHVERTYPLAVEYLKFICFLAEKDIPSSLLPHGEDQQAEDEAVGILRGYAFISVREQGGAFDIHRLVRLATRNWANQEWDVYYTKAIQRLAEVYPCPKYENRSIWMRYLPHAQVALVDHQQCRDRKAEADLLHVVADSYDELGKYNEAEKMHRQALELRKSVLQAEHPDTLISMNNLALVLDSQGKYEEAAEMHRQTLELAKSVLGAEHPSVLTIMNNLALVLDSLGKYEEAEEMHRETLALKKSVLGAEHPSTLASMNNLAEVLDRQGKYKEAEEMHRQTLELKKFVLGAEHPDTLSSVNNLAGVLDSQGEYEEAAEMHRETLELRKSVLGAEHPRTLDSMNNLALVLGNQGKYGEAERMLRETLGLRKSVLGAEHPRTLASMNNLAEVFRHQGKYEEAAEMHRETLGLRKSVLGAEHPSAFDSMNALSLVFDSAGRYGESEILQRQALQGYRAHLGPDHPRTLASMNNLAEVFRHQGKYEEAAEMHRETLGLRKSVLGAEHLSTLSSMNNLSNVLKNQGKCKEAEDIYRDTLELQAKVLGPSHPSTSLTSRNLQQLLAAKAHDTLGEPSDDSGDDGGVAI